MKKKETQSSGGRRMVKPLVERVRTETRAPSEFLDYWEDVLSLYGVRGRSRGRRNINVRTEEYVWLCLQSIAEYLGVSPCGLGAEVLKAGLYQYSDMLREAWMEHHECSAGARKAIEMARHTRDWSEIDDSLPWLTLHRAQEVSAAADELEAEE